MDTLNSPGELVYILRRLRRAPAFAAVSVMTLALGIGANAAIFSVVDGVLLEPLPFEEPERLVGLWHRGFGADEGINQSPATYYTYREEGRAFEDVGMWDNEFVSVTGRETPEQVDAMYVTDGTLPILGVTPVLGRLFTTEDDAPDGTETVILSYGYWQSRFGGDANVVGDTLRIDGRPREIVGVLPQGFHFLRVDPVVWLPFQFDRTNVYVGDFSYQALGRLADGVSIEEANADVARMIPLVVEKFPKGMTLEMLEDAGFGPNVRPLKADFVGDIGDVLWVLMGTVGVVLLIACANVANLFLVRADGRQQEIAVRIALGASRLRLAREFLAESVTLGALGGLGGLALAYGGIRALVMMAPEGLPRPYAIGVHPVVLVFTATISILSGMLFGLAPLLKYVTLRLTQALREGGRASSDGRERHRGRSTLVVSQIALALVLLIGAGLMLKSFQALRKVQPGFVRPEEVLTIKIDIPEAEIEDAEAAGRAHLRIKERLEQIPGVRSVGLSSSITMDGWDSGDGTHVEDFPTPDNQVPPIRRYKWISEDYFETMGNPVIAGRGIVRSDLDGHSRVAVVTENLAMEYWGGAAHALGKRIRESPKSPWREIVGVVGNVYDDGVTEAPVATVFWPMIQPQFWGRDVFVRRMMGYAIRSPRVGSPALLDEIREAVWSLNDNLPIAGVFTLDELLHRSMARTSFTLVMLAIASAMALMLGAVGIYGVMSYAVSRRRREFGVRIALGAGRADVSRMVLRDGLVLTLAGLAVGAVAASILTRLLSALLHGVEGTDPTTYLILSLSLGAIALFACYLPARRASRVHPTEALRFE